ncbi:hypothetical protein NFI96_003316 [Prochilodus magdalenae]|nr:hypothetical protein NFI96_003316 [Prochilodus magdalenae]
MLKMGWLYWRAIYFAAYSTAKEKLNGVLEPDSTQVHMVSAGLAAVSNTYGTEAPELRGGCRENRSCR